MERKVDRPERNDSDMSVDASMHPWRHYDSVCVSCIYCLGNAQTARPPVGKPSFAGSVSDSAADPGGSCSEYNVHTAQIENYWLWDHLRGPSATMPLLVMDMDEHSHQMDFGAATAKYVDAFFQNIRWDAVMARLEQARRLSNG